MILVDTNVVIDFLVSDPVWLDWSVTTLARCRTLDAICINEIGYAELAARMDSEATLRAALDTLGLTLERIPTAALFVAGQAFRQYRAAGGPRPSVLADFFIGAHAQAAQIQLLTRDVRRYRTYFPDVMLISP